MRRNLQDAALFLLIMLMCCLGCGRAEPGVWVNDGISMSWALAACDTWAPMGVSCVPAVSQESAMVVVSDSGEIGCEPSGGVVWAGQGGRGWVHMHMGCYPGTNQVYDPVAVAELAHEFGHALGCEHVSDPMSLMSPAIGAQRLSLYDVAEYQRANPN